GPRRRPSVPFGRRPRVWETGRVGPINELWEILTLVSVIVIGALVALVALVRGRGGRSTTLPRTPGRAGDRPTAGDALPERRLARSNTAIGNALLALLSRGGLSEEDWEEVEDTLLASDLGVEATEELVTSLRRQVAVDGTTDPVQVKQWLHDDLLALVDPSMD